jgi:hypothetical protein
MLPLTKSVIAEKLASVPMELIKSILCEQFATLEREQIPELRVISIQWRALVASPPCCTAPIPCSRRIKTLRANSLS